MKKLGKSFKFSLVYSSGKKTAWSACFRVELGQFVVTTGLMCLN